MLSRPRFQPGWVAQQAALGPDAYLLWDGVEIRWLGVIRAECWLHRRAMYLMPLENASYLQYLTHPRTLSLRLPDKIKILFLEIMTTRCKPMSTLEILHYSRPLKLKDAKDRIYAMAMATSGDAMTALRLAPGCRGSRSDLDIFETSLFDISRRR